MAEPVLRHIPPGLSQGELLRQIEFSLEDAVKCRTLMFPPCFCGELSDAGVAGEFLDDLRTQPPADANTDL